MSLSKGGELVFYPSNMRRNMDCALRPCYDSAPMESFRGSLKNELVHRRRYATRALTMPLRCTCDNFNKQQAVA